MARRTGLVAAGSALALLAAGVITWRVLAPAEVVTTAVRPYPSMADVPPPGAIGALVSSPLILDDRLRAYAAPRQVWSDDQPGYRWETSPFWSLRRWPARLAGVVTPTTASPVVASLWSDGQLIGQDGRTGRVAWRAETGQHPAAVDGRRTGTTLTWTPEHLRTGVTADGRGVIIVVGAAELLGYAADDGTRLWAVPRGCTGGDLTGPGAYLTLDPCGRQLIRIDLATGTTTRQPRSGLTLTGLGCRVDVSECAGLRVLPDTATGAQGTADVFAGANTTEAPALAGVDSWLALTAAGAPVAVAADGTGRDPATGEVRWHWRPPDGAADTSPARIIAATPGRLMLITANRTLITLDPADGTEISRASLLLKQDGTAPYEIGPVYAAGRYVAIERHTPGVPPTAGDDEYYYTNRPILLAAS